MTDVIIGTSQAAIDGYEREALAIFTRIHGACRRSWPVPSGSPTRGRRRDGVQPGASWPSRPPRSPSIDEAMQAFATAVTAVTSNIARSLGAGDVQLVYVPPALELRRRPVSRLTTTASTPPHSTRSRYRPARRESRHRSAARREPDRLRSDPAGDGIDPWLVGAGEGPRPADRRARPDRTLAAVVDQVVARIAEFLEGAKQAAVEADATGLGLAAGGERHELGSHRAVAGRRLSSTVGRHTWLLRVDDRRRSCPSASGARPAGAPVDVVVDLDEAHTIDELASALATFVVGTDPTTPPGLRRHHSRRRFDGATAVAASGLLSGEHVELVDVGGPAPPSLRPPTTFGSTVEARPRCGRSWRWSPAATSALPCRWATVFALVGIDRASSRSPIRRSPGSS